MVHSMQLFQPAEAKSASGEVTHAASTNSAAAVAARLTTYDIDYKRVRTL